MQRKRINSRYTYLHETGEGLRVVVSAHAIIQARKREIAYPDHVMKAITNGKMQWCGRNIVKFITPTITCVGEKRNEYIIIRTVERT